MVAARRPVAKPTGIVNHNDIVMLAVLKWIIGGKFMACNLKARDDVLSGAPDFELFQASTKT
jgi:hypothetical protein